jgi:hypothetical protein
MTFIETPLPDTLAWIRHIEHTAVPVLSRTADALAHLRKRIDDLAPREVADVVIEDPLMSLKVLIWAGKRLARNMRVTRSMLGNEIDTIETAIVSTGIAPFFRKFEHLETVEARLATLPEARLGLLQVLGRSMAAANFASDWAGYRNDLYIRNIAEAAMLHDVAEMLVWVFAPKLSLRMQAYRRTFPQARASEVQKLVLGITFSQLEFTIVQQWHVSGLLKKLTDEAYADTPQVKNVVLAANLARHLANSSNDPALPDDFAEIGKLLRTSPEWVREHVLGEPQENLQPIQAG